MAFISKAAHYKFKADIKRFLSNTATVPGEADNLDNMITQLELLYEKYQVKITQLHFMINEYETIQKDIKLALRKQKASAQKALQKIR